MARRFPEGNNTSVRRRQVWTTCPRRHRYQYVDKLPEGDAGAPARVGKTAHHAIELLGAEAFEAGAEPPSLERLDALVEVAAARHARSPEELADARARLANGKHLIVLRGLLCPPEEPWTCHMGEGLIDGGVWDLVRAEERPYGQTVVVDDYKTGGRLPPTADELAQDLQAGSYLVAARDRWPEAAEVKVRFVYLAHAQVVEVRWTRDLDEQHRAWARATETAIRSGYDRPRPSRAACEYCPYTERCDAFQAAVMAPPPEPDWKSLAAVIEAHVKVKDQEKLVVARRKQLDVALKGWVGRQDRVEAEGFEAAWRGRRVRNIDPQFVVDAAKVLCTPVSDVLGMLGTSVTAKKVDALVKAHPQLEPLARARTIDGRSSWIHTRELSAPAGDESEAEDE